MKIKSKVRVHKTTISPVHIYRPEIKDDMFKSQQSSQKSEMQV